jgi:hypothetical protein
LSKSWNDPFSTKRFLSILQVALSGEDISVNTEVWDFVVLIPFISVLLKFPWGSGLSFASSISIACWDRLLLSKSWDNPFAEFGFSVLEVALGGKNISVYTKVWYLIILIPLVSVLLEFPWGSSLSFTSTISVASWD